MRQRLPLILSATAVIVSVLGSTSIGEAAGNAVGQTVQKAKATAELASPTVRRGPRGPRGFRGRRGPRGPVGPPGTAVAYAHVSGFGALDTANSKSVTSATRVAVGRYCVVAGTVKNAVATIGQSGFGIGVDIAFPSSNCPNGIEVRTFDGDGVLVDNDFYITVN